MSAQVAAIVSAFGIVFLAELGDKTQLLAVGFGARNSPGQVLLGLILGYGSANLIAVIVGALLGTRFPQRPIEIVGGLIFVLFGVLALRPVNDDTDATSPPRFQTSAIAAVGLAILVAEMGDKTQIATTTLATRSAPLGTWLGATAGAVGSGMVGVLAGTFVGDRLSVAALRLGSAALFISFGIALIAGWP